MAVEGSWSGDPGLKLCTDGIMTFCFTDSLRQLPTWLREDSILNDCTLKDCTLNDCALNDFALNDCTLNDCTLNDCALNDCTLNDCALKYCTLSDCTLNYCILNDCTLDEMSVEWTTRPRIIICTLVRKHTSRLAVGINSSGGSVSEGDLVPLYQSLFLRPGHAETSRGRKPPGVGEQVSVGYRVLGDARDVFG